MESNKLPEDFKAKWIAALRSGEYKQGKSVMYDKDDDTYCCLGVAGAICGATKEQMDTGYFDKDTPIIPSGYPDLLVNHHHIRGELLSMNDSRDFCFQQIADYIETNL